MPNISYDRYPRYDHLTSSYGSDREVTRALDSRTFYLVPRVNPDGAVAEWIVRAPAGSRLPVEVRHDRAGVVTTTVELG